MRIRHTLLKWLGMSLAVSGCSRGPARVPAPAVDAQSAADAAMQAYDKNSDQRLDKIELVRCPGILGMFSVYDQNGDGSVDRQEIVERLNGLLENRIGLTRLRARVTYQGKPLSGATVVFEPESYLGSEVRSAEGITNSNGSAQMGIAAEHLPDAVKQLKAVNCGTFKVRITHPKIKLSPKYNTETTLGYETRLGDPYATFTLKAR